jgi:broad specificity phosphatase PhoE
MVQLFSLNMLQFPHKKIYLIRHGETEWTLNGKHTGTTDIPLTKNGEMQAELIGNRLRGHAFQMILSSPLQRAANTCEIAGFLKEARRDPDLVEWNYGEFEGLTMDEIHKKIPHWNIFSHGAPGGESVADLNARANRVLAKIQFLHGDVALFSHGHFLRALAARWLQLMAEDGRLFALYPASISILGFEHNAHVLNLWNEISHLNQNTSFKG